MNNENYAIQDQHGNILSGGFSYWEGRKAAQKAANKRQEIVTLYPEQCPQDEDPDSYFEENSEDFVPEHIGVSFMEPDGSLESPHEKFEDSADGREAAQKFIKNWEKRVEKANHARPGEILFHLMRRPVLVEYAHNPKEFVGWVHRRPGQD